MVISYPSKNGSLTLRPPNSLILCVLYILLFACYKSKYACLSPPISPSIVILHTDHPSLKGFKNCGSIPTILCINCLKLLSLQSLRDGYLFAIGGTRKSQHPLYQLEGLWPLSKQPPRSLEKYLLRVHSAVSSRSDCCQHRQGQVDR